MLLSCIGPSDYNQILHISLTSHHIHHVFRTFTYIVELDDNAIKFNILSIFQQILCVPTNVLVLNHLSAPHMV